MQRLLIDIGNSYIKGIIGKDKVIIKSYFQTPYNRNKFQSEFDSFIKSNFYSLKNKISSVGISLCENKYKAICLDIIKKKLNLIPYFVSLDSKLPLRVNYPRTLGVDRICSSVAAIKRYENKSQLLVIDYGTATTFNIIINKTFLGGLICPGVKTSLNSLIENTNLPKPKLIKKINIISKDTKSAIVSGTIFQTIGLTEYVIDKLKSKYKNLYVISTGGLGEFFVEKIKSINKHHTFLVLEGINQILKLNSK